MTHPDQSPDEPEFSSNQEPESYSTEEPWLLSPQEPEYASIGEPGPASGEPPELVGKRDAIVSLVTGLISLLFIGIVLGPVALYYGWRSRRDTAEAGVQPQKMATWGMIAGGVGALSWLLLFVLLSTTDLDTEAMVSLVR